MANNGTQVLLLQSTTKKKEKGHLIKPLLVALLVTSTRREFFKDSNKIIDLAHVVKPQAEDSVLPRMYTTVQGERLAEQFSPN